MQIIALKHLQECDSEIIREHVIFVLQVTGEQKKMRQK